jgi:hypothetical protein
LGEAALSFGKILFRRFPVPLNGLFVTLFPAETAMKS